MGPAGVAVGSGIVAARRSGGRSSPTARGRGRRRLRRRRSARCGCASRGGRRRARRHGRRHRGHDAHALPTRRGRIGRVGRAIRGAVELVAGTVAPHLIDDGVLGRDETGRAAASAATGEHHAQAAGYDPSSLAHRRLLHATVAVVSTFMNAVSRDGVAAKRSVSARSAASSAAWNSSRRARSTFR